MGKYIAKKKKARIAENKYIFEVKVNIHGKRHTEYYSINKTEVKKAKSYGYLGTVGGYTDYLDWKPLGGAKNIEGGLKKVDRYSYDEKYIYAHTSEKIYSLPRYLEKKMPRKDYILFGKRENDKRDI